MSKKGIPWDDESRALDHEVLFVTLLYIVLAMLSAACFYAATSHSRMFRLPLHYQAVARGCGVILCAGAITAATQSLGFWAGFYAVLTALMLGCVAMPYVDAWLNAHGKRRVE